MNNRILNLAACIAGLLLVTEIFVVDHATMRAITVEDGPIETLSGLLYLMGAACCIVAIRSKQYVRLAWLWALLCILFFGEETSWMQRYLHYSVPAVERVSAQSEFNLHNLAAMESDDPLIDGKGLHLKASNIFVSRTLFRVGFFSYFLLFPLVCINRRVRATAEKIGLLVPSSGFVIALMIPITVGFALTPFADPIHRHGLSEGIETIYALGIFIYTSAFLSQRKAVEQGVGTA